MGRVLFASFLGAWPLVAGRAGDRHQPKEDADIVGPSNRAAVSTSAPISATSPSRRARRSRTRTSWATLGVWRFRYEPEARRLVGP
jgi:hypothetical protein